MLKSKLFYIFLLGVFVTFSCAKEEVNSTKLGDEISQQISEDNTTEEVNSDRAQLGIGWRCVVNNGPYYNMDLYNAGIQTSGSTRYLHVYDLEKENEDGPYESEVLWIGTWIIPANATAVDIGNDYGSTYCDGPESDCGIGTNGSLLETNTRYYYEVDTDPCPYVNASYLGNINQYHGTCVCL